MLEIFGKQYYIDLDEIIDQCRLDKNDTETDAPVTINVYKYDIIKLFIENILNEYNENEDNIAVFAEKETSIPFKIAFNTLIKHGIIVEDYEE